jgi:dTDP-4-dehydrorhamnose reductase
MSVQEQSRTQIQQRILITGSNGLLGQKLVALFTKNEFEVYAFSKGKNRNFNKNYEYYNVNITSFEKVTKLIKKIKPDFIINAAAMTNVDNCELRKRECIEINVNAVKNLANCCKEQNIHLIHISTDFIFDGKKGNYREDDKANPINYYGLSKLNSEKIIKQSKINYTILRTILVYGLVKDASRSNIVLWVKGALEKNEKINLINDQFRMPTYSNDLAQACLLAVQKRAEGIFHISSNELLSVYEIALQIAAIFKLDKSLIKSISTAQLNQRADRPAKTGFVIDKAVKELGFKSVSFKEQLKVFKKEMSEI